MRVKPFVRRVHLWAGLAAALPLAVLAVTGALLVFPGEVRRIVERTPTPPAHDRPPVPPSIIIHAVETALPGDRVTGISYLAPDSGIIEAFTTSGRTATVSAADGSLIDARHRAGSFGDVVIRLHTNFLAGRIGGWATAVVSLMLAGLAASGVYLWWPRGPWAWHYFAVKWTAGRVRANYDLHRVVGFYASALLLAISLTGVAMSFHGATSWLAHLVTWSRPQSPPPKAVAAVPDAPLLTADDLHRLAEGWRPGYGVTFLPVPENATKPVRVNLSPGGDRESRLCRVRLTFHPATGELLHEDSPFTASRGEWLMRWVGPLHFGTFGGQPTRWLYVVVSLSPVLLAFTGLLVWRKRAWAAGRRVAAVPTLVRGEETSFATVTNRPDEKTP